MQIPVVDPDEIPLIVKDDDDWRARYDAIREKHPFFRVGDDPTVWFSRYDAAREIFTNGEIFWEGPFGGHTDEVMGTTFSPTDRDSAEEGVRQHIAFRQMLMEKFGPSEARRWEGVMHRVANELIDKIIDKGECEFIHDFARAYFPYIGADMLGAPREDWDMLTQLEHEAFKIQPGFKGKILDLDTPAMRQIIGYIFNLMDEKRRNPDDRFCSWVVQQLDAGIITPGQARWAVTIFVLGSGHTVAAHLGYLFRHFADTPALQERVTSDPEGVNNLGEEMLRIYSLFGHTRTVTQDIEFHGCPLKKGDQIFVSYSMVNRDPRAAGFDHVELDRRVNRHLAFNQGWRQCIGLHFARRARNIAIQEWHKRIPRYELGTHEPLVEQVYAGVGYHSLPLKWQVG